MSILKFNPFTGPKDWYFKDPTSGYEYKANNLRDLCKHIRAYREQNKLEPLEYLEATVEHYLCSRPENVGACSRAPKLKRGIFQYLKGGIALLQNIAYKSFVAQEEADRRAEICTNCPHNFFPDKGPFITWSDDIAEQSVGDHKSKFHDELGNCKVCSCPLRAKVWWKGKIDLKPKEIEEMKKVNCWQPALSAGELSELAKNAAKEKSNG